MHINSVFCYFNDSVYVRRKFLFNSSSKLSSEPWSRSLSSELVLRVWTESAYCYKFRYMEQLGSGLFNRVI